jgi:hypothetical protein
MFGSSLYLGFSTSSTSLTNSGFRPFLLRLSLITSNHAWIVSGRSSTIVPSGILELRSFAVRVPSTEKSSSGFVELLRSHQLDQWNSIIESINISRLVRTTLVLLLSASGVGLLIAERIRSRSGGECERRRRWSCR